MNTRIGHRKNIDLTYAFTETGIEVHAYKKRRTTKFRIGATS